jgi:hypothetical protein
VNGTKLGGANNHISCHKHSSATVIMRALSRDNQLDAPLLISEMERLGKYNPICNFSVGCA